MSNLVKVKGGPSQGLYTHIVGRRILYYPELGSTMDEAARLAAEGADEGTVVIAEVQTAGRGRQGRTWVSRPGNLLLLSVAVPAQDFPAAFHQHHRRPGGGEGGPEGGRDRSPS